MPVLDAREIARRFGAVVALSGASLSVEPGEAHALLGANGAGKSTLIKVLTGVLRPDAGSITFQSQAVDVTSPRHALSLGLGVVFQDPALAPDLTISENLQLSRFTGDQRALFARLVGQLGVPILDLGTRVRELPLPVVRILDLARVLAAGPRLLLLDELTAELPADLSEGVFAYLKQYTEEGGSIVYVSHRLAEVRAVCARATVLRDGTNVGTVALRDTSDEGLLDLMLGQRTRQALGAGQAALRQLPDDSPFYQVRGLSWRELHDISLDVRRGEIAGVAALEGQGAQQLFQCLAGSRTPDRGEVLLQGRRVSLASTVTTIRAGVAYVPAERVTSLLRQRSVRENVGLALNARIAHWFAPPDAAQERRVSNAIDRLQVDMRASRQVRRLSGGNQQKVSVARWLARGFKVFLAYDPTRGIDVGTKQQIYTLLRELAHEGAGILLYSGELPELLTLCDRIVAVYQGRVQARFDTATLDEGDLLAAMHGLAAREGSAGPRADRVPA